MVDVLSRMSVVLEFVLPYVFLCLVLYILLSNFQCLRSRNKKFWNSLLVVTAHPDDECMFFAPTILDFTRRRLPVSLLCLSTGNYYKQGEKRREELINSCEILGIPKENINVIDRSCFPDDPARIWNEELVAREILAHIENIKPNVVITFDSYGVSGHNNHRSIYTACRKFLQEGRAPAGMNFFALESVGVVRKYISFLDLPFCNFITSNIYISGLKDLIRAQRAMYAYLSQRTWFRILYVLFSRYMLINTLEDIVTTQNTHT